MGANDAREMLEVAKAEVVRLEAQVAGLAAVIEYAKGAPYHDIIRDGVRIDSVYSILASADTDAALRERDAEKWDEGFVTCDEWNGAPLDEGGAPVPVNPYREGAKTDG